MTWREDFRIQGFLLGAFSLPIYLFDRYIIGPVVDIRKHNRGRRG